MLSNSVPTVLTQIPLGEGARTQYSDVELRDYFECIKIPQKYLDSPVLKDASKAGTKEHGLPLLRALTRYHICNVPLENLVLHYSTDNTVTLDPSELYTKIVRRRRGGRCMENNTFFATVLRSIGYEVRNCGGRVARAMSPYPEVRRNQGNTYGGWGHMLNLVRLDDEWYVVDVGMPKGPNLPYPLRDGFQTTSIAPRLIRVQLRPIPESYARQTASSTEPPRIWCFDVCYNPADDAKKEWLPVYCFTETEFLPQDYEVMSWFTSTNSESWFTRYVTCTKMLMDEDKGVIVGNVTLFQDTVRETIGANTKVIKECKTEDERLQALAEIFDVHLTNEEKKGIPNDRKLA
ncbi:cysteine proteinase [Aspergillus costaricaensis CBS 115574]|uniref:Cysteine proteinase n=1 Tax=Aspergillus costaricaensis CBS 115574 TaxID=1448317 RepID=A0ACD1IFH0_9EURO|nr:cysteine proteinase [Aspergillus costaricaensis CBS 115574]RAK89368.1 cysteine proteinase [Aspergillus costaricaensis CBS 115574]